MPLQTLVSAVIGSALIGALLLQMNGQGELARGIFVIPMAGVTVAMAIRYAFELWLLSTGQHARLRARVGRTPITASEGEGPPVKLRGRLLFFWPLAILGFGLATYLVWAR